MKRQMQAAWPWTLAGVDLEPQASGPEALAAAGSPCISGPRTRSSLPMLSLGPSCPEKRSGRKPFIHVDSPLRPGASHRGEDCWGGLEEDWCSYERRNEPGP